MMAAFLVDAIESNRTAVNREQAESTPSQARTQLIEALYELLPNGDERRREQLEASLRKSTGSDGWEGIKLFEETIKFDVQSRTEVAENQNGDLSETEGPMTGEIFGTLAMLSDKILGKKRFFDTLKKVGTVTARR